jgi:hypothetical protein
MMKHWNIGRGRAFAGAMVAGLLAGSLAGPALAQTGLGGSGDYNFGQPYSGFSQPSGASGLDGIMSQLHLDITGPTPPCTGAPFACTTVIGIIAPYQYTDISYQQVASFSTATGFTPPTGATYCVVQAETNNVRYREDGTNPTASTGLLLQVGGSLPFSGSAAQLAAIKFIPVSGNAVLDVDCLK